MQPDVFKSLGFQEQNQNNDTFSALGFKPIEQENKVSGLQAFIQDIARAPLKLPTTVAALGAKTIALGAEIAGRPDIAQRIDKSVEEGIDYGYFGNVKPLSSIKEAIGTGAEIGSYAIGGEGAVGTVAKGLKGQIARGLISGAKTGAASGGLFSFGQSMQEAESKPMDIAYNTLFGTGIGGVAGGVLGGVTPAVVKGTTEALKFTKVPELQTKLSEGFKKIFNPTARQVKADTRFGNNSFDFLAREAPDLPITVNSAGRVEADAAIEMAKQKYAAEAAAYKPIIRNSGKYVDIDEVIANAKKAARQEFDGTDLTKAEQQIENEVNAYLMNTPQDVNVTANGKRFVTLARADDIKSYSWARGKGWGTPEAEVWNDTNNIIGHSIKDAIEKQLPDAPIKAMNRRLGQWKNAIDMLEKRNGQVSGSGGKISKYLIKSVGTTVGAGLGGQDSVGGGLAGAGTGFMTASALAAIMSNPNVRLFAVRQLLQRLSKAGRNDMIKEAEDILKQQASKYLLPAAGKTSYIERPIPVAQAGQRLESVGTRPVAQSIPNTRQATAPNVAPTIQDTMNVNIPNTIQQNTSTINDKLLQEAKKYKTVDEFVDVLSNNRIRTRTVDPKSKDLPFDTYIDEGELLPGIKFADFVKQAKKGWLNEIVDIWEKANKVNQKGGQQVFGGIAGIEVKKDENGELVVDFDPEKAIAGVIGMTAYNKLAPAIKNQSKIRLTEELASLVRKEIRNVDLNAVMVRRGTNLSPDFGNIEASTILETLKNKLRTDGLSKKDIITAIPALKNMGVDVMKDAVKKVTSFNKK